jgi:PmbA protein
MNDLTRLSQVLIEESTRGEPAQAEVCADESIETKVVFENTDFSVASTSQSTIFGLRAIVNNRLGFITTNSLDEKDLREMAQEAKMVARLSPENPHHKIAAKQPTAGTFAKHDEKLALVQPKEILKWAEYLVDESRKDPRVALDRVELNLSTGTRLIRNSNGVLQQVKSTSCSWFVMGMAKQGNEVTSFDYESELTGNYTDVESLVARTAKDFRESVLGSLESSGCKSYKGPVLLHPSAVASLLVEAIGFNINGRAQQDGMSKWKGKQGSEVASPMFSISENPLDEHRLGQWSPFDREGVMTKNRDIIKNGKLEFTAHNCFSAARAGIAPTGNATGGARSVPGIGLHNLSVKAGDASQEDLYKALNAGIVIKRFSGNSDQISGQFSGVAKNSWRVENGKRGPALKEVMVSGNMLELLNEIKMIGARSYRQGGSFESPYILVDGVSVTSG